MTNEELADWKCNCGSVHLYDHDERCALFECPEFYAGIADWDDDTQSLYLNEWKEDDEDYDVTPKQWPSYSWNGWSSIGWSPTTAPTATTATTMFIKCRHFQQEVALPDGTVVYASSCYDHDEKRGDFIPDLGIYLDGAWEPDCIAFYIGCPDYSYPTPSVDCVMHMANQALEIARDGSKVEIGCVGGHGRTGMFLGLLTVMTMKKPNGPAAVKYVKENYCEQAIESADQKWYIDGWAAEVRGKKWPAKPPKPKISKTMYYIPKENSATTPGTVHPQSRLQSHPSKLLQPSTKGK